MASPVKSPMKGKAYFESGRTGVRLRLMWESRRKTPPLERAMVRSARDAAHHQRLSCAGDVS